MKDISLRHPKRGGGELIIEAASSDNIDEMLELQSRCVDPATFCLITKEELLESVRCDLVLIARDGERIAAFAQFVSNRECDRSLSPKLGLDYSDAVTFDGVIVDPDCRGCGLQRRFLSLAEEYAARLGAGYLLATVAEANIYSKENFRAMGFAERGAIPIYGLARILVSKKISK